MEYLFLYINNDVKLALKLVKILEKKFPCCVEYIFKDNQIRLEVCCLKEDKKQVQKALDNIRG